MDYFRHSIWEKINGELENNNIPGRHNNAILNIPFDSFRIFGFLDDTGFRTCAPGRSTRRRYGFHDDVQRAFYSGYFAGHGLKVQAVTLPNGLFGSIYVSSLRVSDAGILNMSGLNTYLCTLFNEFDMQLVHADNQYPALYGDGIFPQLSTIVARYSSPDYYEDVINSRMAKVRQSIEHIFSHYKNMHFLVSISDRFRLLLHGDQVYKMTLISFFITNCVLCMNETTNNFDCRPPTLEEYIPLSKVLKAAHNIDEAILGEVYHYNY
jgi:hypothetical protein